MSASEARGPRLEVLLVDEEHGSAQATARQIEHRHEVRHAPSVAAAVTELVHRSPHVLVCGRSMRPWTLGVLLEIASTFFPSVRRILYAGSPLSEWQPFMERGLFDVVVSGPVAEEELLEAVSPRR